MNHLPDFLIIGASRCGTSSLFANLAKHPRLEPPDRKAFRQFASNFKEIHFFDKTSKYKLGVDFYRGFFHGPPQAYYYFEATPNYLYHPAVPKRVKEILPNAKFIVMLRNPVDRAWSHFCNWRQKCGWHESILYEQNHEIFKKGVYHEQLLRWFRYFSRNQFLVVRSEDYYSNEHAVLKCIFEFIGIEPVIVKDPVFYDPVKKKKGNAKMPVKIRRDLKTFYRPHINALEALLGRTFGWERK